MFTSSPPCIPLRQAERIEQILNIGPLIPVVTVDSEDQAVALGRALAAGGLKVIEVTLRTPAALGAIASLRRELPDIRVGAGTVMSRADYEGAEQAGAQFVVSPGISRDLLDYAPDSGVPLLPGIATMSELMECYQRGFRALKFFPAAAMGGPAALRAFAGPVPDVVFCPTGGIRQATARDYLALDTVPAVGGTWFTPADRVKARDWDGISELAAQSLAACS